MLLASCVVSCNLPWRKGNDMELADKVYARLELIALADLRQRLASAGNWTSYRKEMLRGHISIARKRNKGEY